MVSYGVFECTTGPILFDMTIFEISTLSPTRHTGQKLIGVLIEFLQREGISSGDIYYS